MTLQITDIPNKGRGVIADKFYEEHQMVSESHFLIFTTAQLDETDLEKFSFPYTFPDADGAMSNTWQSIIALGPESLLNHSRDPNVSWIIAPGRQTIQLWALRDIKKGEEITINYGPLSNERMAELGWLE